MTNGEESTALGVPLHSPAFLFERTSRDASGRTVEFVQSVYRGDRYRIVTELSRPHRAGPALDTKRSGVRSPRRGQLVQTNRRTIIARIPAGHSGAAASRSRVDGSGRGG